MMASMLNAAPHNSPGYCDVWSISDRNMDKMKAEPLTQRVWFGQTERLKIAEM